MGYHYRVEVNFLRLLASCERLIAEDKIKRSPETRKKLQKFAAVLEKQLEALQDEDEASSSTAQGGLPREVATDYAKRVASVSDYASHHTRGPHQNELRARLFELNPHSPRTAVEEDDLPNEGSVFADSSPTLPNPLASEDHQTDETTPDHVNAGLRHRGHTHTDDGARERGAGVRAVGEDEEVLFGRTTRRRPELMTRSESDFSGPPDEEAAQQVLTGDMLDIVGQLKNNSLSLGAILKDDASKLEEIEAQTDNNLHKIKSENQDLQQQLKTSSSNTTWFWIIIVFVALIFVWMVVFIKLFPKI